jgi:UDP-glucose 4-epimerase
MKILVTGGCGFIGSHLVDALVELQHEVIVIDDCSANNEKFYFNDKVLYHKVSICDQNKLINISKGCEFCFHLAAESRLQNAIENPTRAIDVNVGGTLNLLEACKVNNIKGLVFSSTSSIYGLSEEFPITEDNKENCLNPYASTKYCAELLLKNYYHMYGIKSCILRYFNVFGERAPTKGQYALVTGIFLRQKLNNEALTVVGNGSQERDFIYVKDIIKANIQCMNSWNNVDSLTKADIFNIGYGKTVKLIDLARSINDNIICIEERKGEAINNLSSYDKFFKLTGWVPTTHILEWIKTQY